MYLYCRRSTQGYNKLLFPNHVRNGSGIKNSLYCLIRSKIKIFGDNSVRYEMGCICKKNNLYLRMRIVFMPFRVRMRVDDSNAVDYVYMSEAENTRRVTCKENKQEQARQAFMFQLTGSHFT